MCIDRYRRFGFLNLKKSSLMLHLTALSLLLVASSYISKPRLSTVRAFTFKMASFGGTDAVVSGNIYLLDTYKYKLEAKVVSITPLAPADTKGIKHGTHKVCTDQTIFHPQGGGQPSDQGVLKAEESTFTVNFAAKNEHGDVEHYGVFTNDPWSSENLSITMEIDEAKRLLHARIHSAGHALDSAMVRCSFSEKVKPSKGYHFIDGPYVEYQETAELTEAELKDMVPLLNKALADIVRENIPTRTRIETTASEEKDTKSFNRVVEVANLDCPCGGTHVAGTAELGVITVTKAKKKKGVLKVSYTMSP